MRCVTAFTARACLYPVRGRSRISLCACRTCGRSTRLAADEIGSIVARIEAIDLDLDDRGQVGRNGAKSLLEHRVRLSRELRSWLREFGGTPKARADFANRLASSESMAEAITRLRESG